MRKHVVSWVGNDLVCLCGWRAWSVSDVLLTEYWRTHWAEHYAPPLPPRRVA